MYPSSNISDIQNVLGDLAGVFMQHSAHTGVQDCRQDSGKLNLYRSVGTYALTLRHGGAFIVFGAGNILPVGFHPQEDDTLLVLPEITSPSDPSFNYGAMEFLRRMSFQKPSDNQLNRTRALLSHYTIKEQQRLHERFEERFGKGSFNVRDLLDTSLDTAEPVRTLDCSSYKISNMPSRSSRKKMKRALGKLKERNARVVLFRSEDDKNIDIKNMDLGGLELSVESSEFAHKKIKEGMSHLCPNSLADLGGDEKDRYNSFNEQVSYLAFNSPRSTDFNAFCVLDENDQVLAYSVWEYSQSSRAANAIAGNCDYEVSRDLGLVRLALQSEILASGEIIQDICLGGSELNSNLEQTRATLPQDLRPLRFAPLARASIDPNSYKGRETFESLPVSVVPMLGTDMSKVNRICDILKNNSFDPAVPNEEECYEMLSSMAGYDHQMINGRGSPRIEGASRSKPSCRMP